MWLIQWAAEHGLDWLISDGTLFGMMALHPAQFAVYTLVTLIVGIGIGMAVEKRRSGSPRQPRRIPIVSSMRERRLHAQDEAKRASENMESWRRHLMGIDASEKAFLRVRVDEGEAFGLEREWVLPTGWLDPNLNALIYMECVDGGLIRFTPTDQLKYMRKEFSDTFDRVSKEVESHVRDRKEGPPYNSFTSGNRFPRWWWYK